MGYGVVLDAGDRTHRDVCLCAGGEPLAAAVFGGQGECAVQLAAVAAHGDGHERGLPRGETRAHVRGQRGDAIDAAARPIRRDAKRQYVWRYFERCSGGAGWLDWADSFGQLWLVGAAI